MEALWLLLIPVPELFCCVLPVWLSCLLGDVAAFYTSAPNRRERAEAKEKGQPPPPRDIWSWLFVMLLGFTVGLALVMILGYVMLGHGQNGN